MQAYELFELIKSIFTCPTTLEEAKIGKNSFTRKRMMSFFQALCFLLDMQKTALQNRLDDFFNVLDKGTAITQQGFSKLRTKFNHKPFEKLFRAIVQKEYSGVYDLPLWRGWYILAIDGVRLRVPNTKELLEQFGTFGSEKSVSAGASMLYDVLNGFVLDVVFCMAKMNERTECLKHIHFLFNKMSHMAKKCILLMDRGYPSKEMFVELIKSEISFVIRCPQSSLKVINKAPLGESIICIDGIYKLRIIKFKLKNGDIAILATNVFDLPLEDFPELYSLRWGIETMYHTLKHKLCIEHVSGRTHNSIMQDFWASLVLLNATAVFENLANKTISARHSQKDNKNEYAVAISKLIVTLRDNNVFTLLCGNELIFEFKMLSLQYLVSRNIVAIKEGRSFKRDMSKGRKPISHNIKSCLCA